jgi:hypothetical protein
VAHRAALEPGNTIVRVNGQWVIGMPDSQVSDGAISLEFDGMALKRKQRKKRKGKERKAGNEHCMCEAVRF